jgi:hypothetical protein
MSINIKKVAMYIVSFIVLFFIYAKISKGILPSSDAVSGLLEGKDLASGNITLSGWYLSTVSFYFTDIIWYALATKVFWYGLYQAYCIPAIMYAILVLLAFRLSTEKVGALWAFVFCLGVPSGFATLNVLIPVIHIGTYVATLLSFILIDKYNKTGSLASLGVYLLVLTLACFSDDIIKLIVILPVVVSSMFFIAKGKFEKNIPLLLVTIVSYALSKAFVLYAVNHNWFILPGIPDPTFVPFDDIWKNIYLFSKGFILYCGAFFFGKPPSDSSAIIAAFNFLIMTVLIIYTALGINKIFNTSMLNMAICIACIIMIPAYIVSNRPIDEWTIRYIVPFFILSPVIIGRSEITKGFKFNALGAIVIIVLLSSARIHEKVELSSELVSRIENTVKIKDTLRDNGLKNGYASFWFASSVSVDGDMSVAPLDVNHVFNILNCNKWLSKNEWYERGGNFIITDDEQMRNITTSQFGNPSKIITSGDKQIFVYDKKITFQCN